MGSFWFLKGFVLGRGFLGFGRYLMGGGRFRCVFPGVWGGGGVVGVGGVACVGGVRVGLWSCFPGLCGGLFITLGGLCFYDLGAAVCVLLGGLLWGGAGVWFLEWRVGGAP